VTPPFPRVTVAGVPPGATALSEEARARLAVAELVVGAERHLGLVADAGYSGRVMGVEYKVSEAVAAVAAEPGLRAVFIASGDPNFFGIAALLRAKLPAGEVEVLPAVSSMQAAFAAAGLSWSDARFASLHGRPLRNLAPVLGAPKVGVFTDGANNPAAIARFLIHTGWSGLTMHVAADLGMESERVERGTPESFLAWRGSDMNVVILERHGPDDRPLGPGIDEELFAHPRGRITKATVRAAALGLLGLPREGVLWDVGAGSGSVGIEAALLAPGLTVYAVEKDDEAVEDIRTNRRRFRTAGVEVVHGSAPGALDGLETPHRVFIGGSGGNLDAILSLVAERMARDSINGGVAVVSTVLNETFQQALSWARGQGAQAQYSEISVSHSRTTGAGTRLVAQDPVRLIRIEITEPRAK